VDVCHGRKLSDYDGDLFSDDAQRYPYEHYRAMWAPGRFRDQWLRL
jgi:hypothetical protein